MLIRIQAGDAYCDHTILFVLKRLSLSTKMIRFLKYRENGILVNQERVTVRKVLHDGDVLFLGTEDTVSSESATPAPLPLPIVLENESMVIVNKPPHMPTHPSHGHHDDTVANALAYYYASQNIPFVFRPIHRLDKNTSGLVLVARNKIAAALLTQAMTKGQIRKSYLALLRGKLPEPTVTETHFGLCLGKIDTYLCRTDHSVILRRVCASDASGAERAITLYQILRVCDTCTLVEVFPLTGRTHQIRVHFAHLGHPLLADDLYGSPDPAINRHALHAKTLDIILPETTFHAEAPLPDDMKKAIDFYFGPTDAR